MGDKVNRLVVVVSGINSGDTLERWQFNAFVEDRNILDSFKTISSSQSENSCKQNCLESKKFSFRKNTRREKSLKETHNEIQAIIRQITASVTFLPLLNEPCSFDLLVYVDKKADIPRKWEDSDPRYIMNSQNVKLRSFTTSVSINFFLFIHIITMIT